MVQLLVLTAVAGVGFLQVGRWWYSAGGGGRRKRKKEFHTDEVFRGILPGH